MTPSTDGTARGDRHEPRRPGTAVATRAALRRYAVLVVLLLAIVAGVFAAYNLTRDTASSGAVQAPAVSEIGSVGGGCASSHAVSGGVLERQQPADGCGAPGGSVNHGGIQP